MSQWTPCRRREFVRRLRGLGFDGPVSGACHQFVVSGTHRLTIPSNAEYSVPTGTSVSQGAAVRTYQPC